VCPIPRPRKGEKSVFCAQGKGTAVITPHAEGGRTKAGSSNDRLNTTNTRGKRPNPLPGTFYCQEWEKRDGGPTTISQLLIIKAEGGVLNRSRQEEAERIFPRGIEEREANAEDHCSDTMRYLRLVSTESGGKGSHVY